MKAKFQKDDLIAALIKMRLEECASTKTILDFLMNEIGYSKTTAYEYLKLMREAISEQFNLLNPVMIEEAIGQYEEAIERARQRKDWKIWSDLRKELNKIQGVYAAQKVEHSGQVGITGIDIQIVTGTESNVEKKNKDDGTEHRDQSV